MNPVQREAPATVTAQEADDRPTRMIVSDLWRHTETLLDQELQLLRSEFEEKLQRAKKDLVAAALSGVVGLAGFLALVASVILLLAKRIDAWGAALIVGGVLLALAYGLYRRGRRDIAELELTPKVTKASLQRTAHSIQEATR